MPGMTLQEALDTPEVRAYLREIVREETGGRLQETPASIEDDSDLAYLRQKGLAHGLPPAPQQAA